jgi:hypothetical protein
MTSPVLKSYDSYLGMNVEASNELEEVEVELLSV